MYFLQKDDIMLHFTQKGSSDITGFQSFNVYLFVYFFVYLESVTGYKFVFTWEVLWVINLDLNLDLD